MRFSAILFLIGSCIGLFAQDPLYVRTELEYTNTIPVNLNNSRSAVIINVPNKHGEFTQTGNWQKLANEAHAGFVKMRVDVIFYANQIDLTASNSSYQNFLDVFSKRKIENLIFLTQTNNGLELVLTPYESESALLRNKQNAYQVKGNSLKEVLLDFGKEIRRAELVQGNFLIPDKPTFLSGQSIIEKTQLKNYPGQLRRSVLAVEKFNKLNEEHASGEVLSRIKEHNQIIDQKNIELDSIMKSYPYEYVMIESMSDEDLLRNRHQFLLRSVTASATSVRNMLEFDVFTTEVDFVSVIPIMPDRTTIKTIPKDAIVTKFYVRQNISKNVHVGEWDADVTWQAALKNMIGNLSQRLVIRN